MKTAHEKAVEAAELALHEHDYGTPDVLGWDDVARIAITAYTKSIAEQGLSGRRPMTISCHKSVILGVSSEMDRYAAESLGEMVTSWCETISRSALSSNTRVRVKVTIEEATV